MIDFKLQVKRGAPLTPSDTTDIFDPTGGNNKNGCFIYVGGGGDLRVLTLAGNDVVLYNVPTGSILPIQVKQ